MPPAVIQTLPYAMAALPLAFVGVVSAAWWHLLARPWLFLLSGTLALYGLIAVVVAALLFIGPGFSGYFLEVPLEPDQRRPTVDPLIISVLIGVVAFLIIGGAILWALKQWLLKP